MATRTKKDVATTKDAGAVAVGDYGDDAGTGFENQTSADTLIPFINVLQAMSPQCEGEDAKGRPGMLHDSATNDLFSGKEGILIVPCYTQHVVCEWKPRDAGGGLVAQHAPDSAAVEAARKFAGKSFGKVVGESGNDFVDTFYVYVVMCDENDALGMAVLSLSSTKIKPYRQWMSRLQRCTIQVGEGRKIRPPLFAHLTRLTTVSQKHEAGTSFNVVFSAANNDDLTASLLKRDDPRFLAAKQCKEMVEAGNAKADMTGNTKAEGEDTPF